MKFPIRCPCCGQIINIVQKADGEIAVSFFDTKDNSETLILANQQGYEFGVVSAEGGKQDGKH